MVIAWHWMFVLYPVFTLQAQDANVVLFLAVYFVVAKYLIRHPIVYLFSRMSTIKKSVPFIFEVNTL